MWGEKGKKKDISKGDFLCVCVRVPGCLLAIEMKIMAKRRLYYIIQFFFLFPEKKQGAIYTKVFKYIYTINYV